jgi:hypothetical protein
MIGSNLLPSEQEADGLAWFTFCAVAEHDDVKQFVADEARLLKGGCDRR